MEASPEEAVWKTNTPQATAGDELFPQRSSQLYSVVIGPHEVPFVIRLIAGTQTVSPPVES